VQGHSTRPAHLQETVSVQGGYTAPKHNENPTGAMEVPYTMLVAQARQPSTQGPRAPTHTLEWKHNNATQHNTTQHNTTHKHKHNGWCSILEMLGQAPYTPCSRPSTAPRAAPRCGRGPPLPQTAPRCHT
jgi:hypothetical protein